MVYFNRQSGHKLEILDFRSVKQNVKVLITFPYSVDLSIKHQRICLKLDLYDKNNLQIDLR